jgi:hypothetical protein
VKSPWLAKVNLSLQLGNHAPWPTPPLVCGVEVNHCTPERTGAALSPSHAVHDALTAVRPRPRSPLILIQLPKCCLWLGNHQAAGVGSPSLIHAASSPWWPQYRRLRSFNCSATWCSATLPLILPNGSESHPPFCLSPGTNISQPMNIFIHCYIFNNNTISELMNSTLVRLLYAQSKFCVEGGKVHKLFGLENKKICKIINNDICLSF